MTRLYKCRPSIRALPLVALAALFCFGCQAMSGPARAERDAQATQRLARQHEIQQEVAASPDRRHGDQLAQAGKFDEAVAAYSDAISIAPKESELYLQRACANVRLNRFQDAELDFNTALSLNPKSTTAAVAEAEMYKYLAGRTSDANACGYCTLHATQLYTQLISSHPNDPTFYYARATGLYIFLTQTSGSSFLFHTDYSEVRADLDKVIQLDPKMASAYLLRAVAASNDANSPPTWSQLYSDTDEAIRLKPNWAEPYYVRGGVEYEQDNVDRHELAIADARTAASLDPSEPKYAQAITDWAQPRLSTAQKLIGGIVIGMVLLDGFSSHQSASDDAPMGALINEVPDDMPILMNQMIDEDEETQQKAETDYQNGVLEQN